MGLALRDTHKHTYAEYRHWPEDVRYELIEGEAYMMSPAPDLIHQDVAGEIFRQVANSLLGKQCRAFMAPVDVRLPEANEHDDQVETVVQPDVFVVCESNKLDRRGVRGAPDWILEVLSPSTAGHDQIKKRDLYQKHGVKEYWLVHPVDRVLTIYRLENGEYGRPLLNELEGKTDIALFDDISIEWDELVSRLPDDY